MTTGASRGGIYEHEMAALNFDDLVNSARGRRWQQS
jgi:hypothetical protein